MNSTQTRILLFDDDCYNTLELIAFKKMYSRLSLDILSFTDPQEGLNFLNLQSVQTSQHFIILLDMHVLMHTGWQILRKLRELPPAFVNDLEVYILTSPLIGCETKIAMDNPLIKDRLTKPLSSHLASLLFSPTADISKEKASMALAG